MIDTGTLAARTPRTWSLHGALTLALTLTAGLVPGCDSDKGAESNIAKRAAKADEKKSAGPDAKSDTKSAAQPDAKANAPADAKAPVSDSAGETPPDPTADGSIVMRSNPDGERHTLRLGLQEGVTYQVTTIGGLELPAVPKPAGFARKEQLVLKDCSGEGGDRRCTVEHTYLEFDAEPPQGGYMRADEDKVKDLTTTHTLPADGRRVGETTVTGPAEALKSHQAEKLTQVERFYCIRLPDEPIAVGATWASTCKRRLGGKLDNRKTVYKLERLDTEPNTGEKRAEISFVAAYSTDNPEQGKRQGIAKGLLYFWATSGEPHMMREDVILAMPGKSSLKTTTKLQYQFARLEKGGGTDGADVLVRSDGRPFAMPPRTLNLGKPGTKNDGPKYKVVPPPAGAGDAKAGDAKAGGAKAPKAPTKG